MSNPEIAGNRNRVYVALEQLLETYNDLNPTTVDEFDEDPSALEFMRYVARNRPFIIRGGASDWKASRLWNADYLLNIVDESSVNVAITPFGNADAVVKDDEGTIMYVEPCEREEPFRDVLAFIQEQERRGTVSPVKYAQTQNDNLRNEYGELFEDVPASIPFARIALQQEPDAVNFWLGNSRSVTAMHKDNYENIYAQIRGQKHFVLLPPIATPFVAECQLPVAKYVPADKTLQSLRPRLEAAKETRPVPTWDPDDILKEAQRQSILKPMRVTLDEGDMLYLPAMWLHKVSQSCGDESFCCSVNYWYDMDFSGQFWATNNLLRELAHLA